MPGAGRLMAWPQYTDGLLPSATEGMAGPPRRWEQATQEGKTRHKSCVDSASSLLRALLNSRRLSTTRVQGLQRFSAGFSSLLPRRQVFSPHCGKIPKLTSAEPADPATDLTSRAGKCPNPPAKFWTKRGAQRATPGARFRGSWSATKNPKPPSASPSRGAPSHCDVSSGCHVGCAARRGRERSGRQRTPTVVPPGHTGAAW
jgi:hypothetical protein